MSERARHRRQLSRQVGTGVGHHGPGFGRWQGQVVINHSLLSVLCVTYFTVGDSTLVWSLRHQATDSVDASLSPGRHAVQ